MAPTGEGPSAKVSKVTPELSPTVIVESVRNGKTTGLLVGTLRAYLQQQGVDGTAKMNKAALIDQVKQLHDL